MKTLKLVLCLALFAGMSPSAFAQTSGGPDAYGYTWKNSSHTSNPPHLQLGRHHYARRPSHRTG